MHMHSKLYTIKMSLLNYTNIKKDIVNLYHMKSAVFLQISA